MTVDITRLINNIVDNTLFTEQRDRATLNYERLAEKNLPNVFKRFVVLDVITDRRSLDIKKLNSQFGELGNSYHAGSVVVPRNTIIAKALYDSSLANNEEAMNPVLLYPFFPSHLAFPCKPGEHVWAMFESLTERKTLGYWLCRIVGPDHVDDVNHSHAPREHDYTFMKSFVPGSQNEAGTAGNQTPTKPRYHYKNGIYRSAGPGDDGSPLGDIVDAATAFILSRPRLGNATTTAFSSESLYEDILSGSSGIKQMLLEPIPRYNKKPGDVAIEGSNNSLIVLGVEESSLTSAAYVDSIGAGNIDLVAGRGSTVETSGKIADNDLKRKELDKFYDSLSSSEGNIDYSNDRSRILLSQRTKANSSFGLTNYNESPPLPGSPSRPSLPDSASGDAAIVIKSDKVKIIARSDIQLVVQGFSTTTDPLGRDTLKQGNDDVNTWASITIKSNGDIVFTPSKQGFIKLGGDDADRPLMCAAQPAQTFGGIIRAQAVKNTAGGQMGGALGVGPDGKSLSAITTSGESSIDHGTFAAKVLVK